MLVSKRFSVRRTRMLALLAELDVERGPARSLYLPSALRSEEMEGMLGEVVGSEINPVEVINVVSGSATGGVLFWGLARRLLVLPPFPVREKYLAFGYDVETLRSLLQTDFTIALILVRMGTFAIGICQGEKLVLSKVGTGLVHARHKKGGSSQRRFQRRQDREVDVFIERVCGHVRERLEPREKGIDYLVYGGGWEAIRLLQKECRFLHQFENRLLSLMLDIPPPRRVVLEAAVRRVWSSQVIEWRTI